MVIKGTPRINSIYPMLNQRTIGNLLLLPSASSNPSGKEKTIATKDISKVNKKPPHKLVPT